ncbi:MAG: HpcH/HpaI aldolase/citrate lyase family protein [Clostridiales bacterium]|jgi:citrate lyase beta subunit|nr:HpcH/HpaI aldolase/citrate lyase family protein [Clostridiales bacterium]
MQISEIELLPYRVGALMYVPALNTEIGEKLCNGTLPKLDSLAFCIEDSVTDFGVEAAETQLVKTLEYISANKPQRLPLLFVRVRNCAQLKKLPSFLGGLIGLLTGVILPKFNLSNAAEYCSLVGEINSGNAPLYIMPILESPCILNLETRKRTLISIRELLDGCRDYVLNVRVGAMDFCKIHGLRRAVDQSVYDIGVVRDVLTDILTVFSANYVVSAPVWEYFNGNDAWAVGLEKELRLDIANGFIGKTVIHPSQLLIVRKFLAPLREDFNDAKEILNWKDDSLGVAKSTAGNRMNEVATHQNWAKKILILSEIYGVRDANENTCLA